METNKELTNEETPIIVFKDYTFWYLDPEDGKFKQKKLSEQCKNQFLPYKAFDVDADDKEIEEYIKHQEEKRAKDKNK